MGDGQVMTGDRTTMPATYGGPEWEARRGTHLDDVRKGRLWASCGVNSEWGELQAVLLALPDTAWPEPPSWDSVQYLRRVDFERLHDDLLAYAKTLQSLGVDVSLIGAEGCGPAATVPRYNRVFVRDRFVCTPEGAIVARMASLPRVGEERELAQVLAELGVPIVRTITGDGCLEGADLLWLTPTEVVVGVGWRTNMNAYEQVTGTLRPMGVSCHPVPPSFVTQHLLGVVQLVGSELAFVRGDVRVPHDLLQLLTTLGLRVIRLDSAVELQQRQAMNFVTLGSRQVIMASGCPETRRQLADAGVEVAAEVEVRSLVDAGGGLACATGILTRRPV